MKKILVAILALLLAASLAFSAMAWTMYVAEDQAKVYNKNSKKAKVISRLPLGGPVDVFETTEHWSHVNYVNGKGVTKTGWMLTDTIDSKQSHQHSWSSWRVNVKPTCTKAGEKIRTCSGCGKSQTKAIDPIGHDWGSWKVTKQATCAVTGTRTRTCKNCGQTQTKDYIEDHTFSSWEMTVEPTCTQKGERVRTCQVCGLKDVQALDTIPHDYAWRVTLEPTDHSSGTRTKVCVVCGHDGGEESFDPEGTLRRSDRGEDVYNMQQLLVQQGYLNAGGADGIFGGATEKALKQFQSDEDVEPDGVAWPQTLKLLDHQFGPWTTVKAMTRTEAGERMRVCTGCGYEQFETVEPGVVFESGRRGEDIRAMQQMLKQLGYDPGNADGIYGKKLDNALARFAADHGIEVEAGRIRPADVDVVFNAWLERLPADSWKGEGDVDSPVNLALSVTEVEDTDDDGVTAYTWSLTNMGSENASFAALLLTFGDAPDYRSDNLVILLDGFNLQKNSGNSMSGSFNVSDSWGEGALNFAALAMNDSTGAMWLSNSVDFENGSEPAAKTVAPQTAQVNVNALADGIYPVSFNPGDVLSGASGVFMNAVHIYSEDTYDLVDIGTLAAGDTVVVNGEEIPVNTVENSDGIVTVNGEVTFVPLGEDSNGYRVALAGDFATYTELGTTTLMLDPSAVLVESWDIGSDPVTVGYEDIAKALTESENTYFNQYNTSVCVENGRVVEISRVYVE